MKPAFQDRRYLFVCALLALATLAVYWPVTTFDFTNYDDPFIISANPAVASGLTWRGFWWGLTTSYFEFWHPVTWWSHMLDHELFGPRAGLHHLMSLAIHVATTLILFAALRRLTGAVWRSGMVAALFALHPTHVESVAWLAERKDLLCGLFFMLTLWAYARYVEEQADTKTGKQDTGNVPVAPGRFPKFYRWAIIFFALAIMSKPMAVTLPFVLLLLDYWPLGRFERLAWGRLLLEKVPFFGLALGSCAVTLAGVTHAHNIVSTETFPWALRLANVPISYARYLGKLIWPDDLIVLYQMPDHWPMGQAAGATLLVVIVTTLVLVCARARPYLVVGWLLFGGMMVPTIGLVPVGFQSMADRYTYIPYVGLFVAVVWVVADVSKRWPMRRINLGGLAALALTACVVLTARQVQHWRNSGTLWRHCLAINPQNVIAHYNLGYFHQHSGQANEAAAEYREVLRLKPNHLDANLNLGVLNSDLGRIEEATNLFAKALRIKPGYETALVNMGQTLYRWEDFRGATNYMAQALRANSNNVSARCVCALAMLELKDAAGALIHAMEAVRLAPNDYRGFTAVARAYDALGQSEAALRNFAEVLRLNPTEPEALQKLGTESLRRVVQNNPASASAHLELALALAGARAVNDAMAEYRAALKLDPNLVNAQNNLAWMLATQPDEKLRNGADAVQLAERACEQTSYEQVIFIGTLAAAYAEAGDFGRAVATAQKACELAQSKGQTEAWEMNQKLLRQYQEGKPYREGN